MSELVASAEILPARAQSVSLSPAGGSGTILARVRAIAAQPAVAKSLPMLGLIGLLGAAAILWMVFSTPPSRELFAGLPDEDKATVAEALDAAAIAYTLDRDTGALSVGEDEYHRARMLLAAQGLPKSAPDGSALLDKLPMGASRALEGERLRGAREQDLARTIEQIDAVESARVHLAVEPPSVFMRDGPSAAASVMLRLASGRRLSDAQAQAIVHLVASSVPGLAPEGVSLIDQNGRLLSSESAGGTGAEASERQLAAQAKIEDRYKAALAALLTPIVGAGNFTAEVHADVDFSEVQATREGYPKEGAVVQSEQGGWTTDGERAAAGIPGALANQAPPAAEVAAAPGQALTPPVPGATDAANTAKTQENYVRSFAVGREVSVTKQQVGQVRRLSVAVALKDAPGAKPRTPQEIAALEALVKGAVGFDTQRGDLVAVQARTFVTEPVVEPAWYEASWIAPLARNLSALAVAALLVFGLARPLLRRRAAKAATPDAAAVPPAAVGGEIAAALADHAKTDPSGSVTLDMIEAAPSYEARADLIRNFVRQDPARAALVVRDLIRADASKEV